MKELIFDKFTWQLLETLENNNEFKNKNIPLVVHRLQTRSPCVVHLFEMIFSRFFFSFIGVAPAGARSFKMTFLFVSIK